MDICIDFDGTCVTNDFPKIGKDIGAIPILKALVNNGHNLILFTMRSNRKEYKNTEDNTILDVTGDFLDDAINWFKMNNIPLYGIQTHPKQVNWTTSPKAFAQLYIDDTALGCPLMFDSELSDKPYVDWVEIKELLKKLDLI